ncbi:uncharacterized protein LOC123307670 [Coccinella septempunctata]|uniref:uncharacterized protein LOC123307670 n=1 Tax=Coccinella septempunctata TaxID=41139 RepID=UPI001D08DB97|nr:uncharacterized protein LOC123307670 [Coccinella septempunctata]
MASFVGFLYCFCCYSTILAGYFCLYCHLLPVLLISNKLYRCLTDIIFTFWQSYATALLQFLIKCDIEVTGDTINSDEMSIIVMNHRTRTDWNFLWAALHHAICGKNKYKFSTKFVLKDMIRHFPGPGWVMQLTFSIFIRRCWIADKKILESFCGYISALSYKCSVLIFPEGTDFTEGTKKKSDEFALKNNLKQYKHVLHPRTTGFAFLANKLMEEKSLGAVYDITIFYQDCIPQNEKILLRGNFPRKIKIHVERYPADELPLTESGLKKFLENLWYKKEDLLQEYHENPKMSNGRILKCKDIAILRMAFVFWNALLIASFVFFLYSHYFRIICLFHTLFLISINVILPHGFQSIEIKLYEVRKKLANRDSIPVLWGRFRQLPYKMSVFAEMGYFVGILYFYLWFTSILAGYVCLYCPILPILLLSNKLYRYLTDGIITFWQQYPAVLARVLCKTEVEVTGDAIRSNEMSILVMNHRTRTDWNVLWPSLYHCVEGTTSYRHSTKFLLKDGIRHVPGAGWVMQLSFWIFIRRFWTSDRDTLKKLCDYIEALSYKFSMVVFPEGTDFTEETKEKSDVYARKNNLQKYDYLLHPRTTGFAYLSSQLLKQNCLDAVYDLTLVYPDVVPQTEKHLVQGKFPKHVKLHIKRYPSQTLPKSEEDLKKFLDVIWKEKEAALKEFHTTNNFIPGPSLRKSCLDLFPAFIFWTVLPYFAIYLLFCYQEFRKICFLHTVFLLCVDLLTPGFQWFEITLYRLKKEFLGPKFTF